jgi:hypothetical protein
VLAVYAVSFWHYLLYWRAYRHGSDDPARFRRRAVALKTLALAAFAGAVTSVPWHWPSVVVMAAGFLLNALAARALGPSRTYYGWELGEVPQLRVTAFPYSVVPHPMLIGNIAAFGAPMWNPAFRATWWPLALLHVVLNLGLLVMETRMRPPAPRARRSTAAMEVA